MGASVFDRGERRPIAQLKGVPGLLKVRTRKIVQTQAVARAEDQMIEFAELGKESCNGPFVRDINCLPLRCSTEGFNCFLNSFRTARDDYNARSLRCRLLGDSQSNSRGSAEDNYALAFETIRFLH